MDYQVVLAGEMILLITGETGIAMLHGWTEGIGYAMRPFYTPMWTCAILMILLFLLILSLFFVFVGLHFNRPGIVQHHVIALAASWPLAICVIIGGIVSGAPFLVGFVLFLYFSSLLPFAYIYGTAEWKASELPNP
uniref:NADH dehydrogenase subunit 6 n=1 Tax=Ditylenchus dipsaci TaxID=166011 RepID=A0A915EUY2_9BILA